jgi:hypothetical protein
VRVYEDDGTSFPEKARLDVTDVLAAGEPADSQFGFAVAVRGDLLLVGSPSYEILFPGATQLLHSAGNALVFARIGGKWRYSARLRGAAADAFGIAAGDAFGNSVALDGTTGFVGAPFQAGGGAAFVIDLSGN